MPSDGAFIAGRIGAKTWLSRCFKISIYLELSISGIVQSYYIWRIWHVRQSVPIVAFLIFALLARLGTGYRATAFTGINETWKSLYTTKGYQIYLNFALSLNVVMDSLITAVLSVFLYQTRQSARSSTKNMVLKLIFCGVTAGVLTLMASVVILVTFNASKGTITYGGCLQIMAKLYANSMLAMLNARQRIVRSAASSGGCALELPELQNRGPTAPRPGAAIHVLTEVITKSETWSSTNGQKADEHKISTSDSPRKYEIACRTFKSPTTIDDRWCGCARVTPALPESFPTVTPS
ncbi:hypothetical protein BC835DRAFT_1423694 [Cytidiella melzeri]|nr:hypothetical protein BC835DRAFT_1423694 [Cytidiella melzeri]